MKAHVRAFSLLLFVPLVSAWAAPSHLDLSSEEIEIREIASSDIPLRVVCRLDGQGRSVELDDGAI